MLLTCKEKRQKEQPDVRNNEPHNIRIKALTDKRKTEKETNEL